MERALKHALGPLASAALAREVDLVCEVLPDVGEYVLGERREFMDLVARATAPAMVSARGGEVSVRVARQKAGFDATDRVLVSVSIRRPDGVEDVESLEMVLPIAQRVDAREEARELTGMRVLLVVPGLYQASVQRLAARRFGATVESVHDVGSARERMREAARQEAPIDVLYLDDTSGHVVELLHEVQSDSSLGNPSGLVGTALGLGPARDAYRGAGAALTLSKPVLPFELRDTLMQVRDMGVGNTLAPSAAGLDALSAAVSPRRASGIRRVRLAEVLASLAIGSDPRRR